MREILFRGKRIDGGWIEGDYINWTVGNPEIAVEYNTGHKRSHEVIPETVGQYTGLTDKNGTKIFEGDILEGHLDDYYPDNSTIVSVIWYENSWCILENGCLPVLMDNTDSQYFCVIGNIHDNPELLEVRE